jgi:hypothetical protein
MFSILSELGKGCPPELVFFLYHQNCNLSFGLSSFPDWFWKKFKTLKPIKNQKQNRSLSCFGLFWFEPKKSFVSTFQDTLIRKYDEPKYEIACTVQDEFPIEK